MPSGSLIKKYGFPNLPTFIAGFSQILFFITNSFAFSIFSTHNAKCFVPMIGKSVAKLFAVSGNFEFSL